MGLTGEGEEGNGMARMGREGLEAEGGLIMGEKVQPSRSCCSFCARRSASFYTPQERGGEGEGIMIRRVALCSHIEALRLLVSSHAFAAQSQDLFDLYDCNGL